MERVFKGRKISSKEIAPEKLLAIKEEDGWAPMEIEGDHQRASDEKHQRKERYHSVAYRAPPKIVVAAIERRLRALKKKCGELKFADTQVTGSVSWNAATLWSVVGVAEGLGEDERVGSCIRVKDVEVKCTITTPAMSWLTVDNFLMYWMGLKYRCVVIHDCQCNGAAPTTSDIFQVFIQGQSQTLTDVPYNNANTDRFTVLRDHIIEAKPRTMVPFMQGPPTTFDGVLAGSVTTHHEWRVPVNYKIKFKGTGDQISRS